MKKIEVAQPLPMEGAYNVRDLGFYTNKDGKKLREGRFLRSDALSRITEHDKTILRDYGVTCVVDLRSPAEVEKAPCLLRGEGISYYTVPFFDNIQSNDGSQKLPDSLHDMYIGLLSTCSQQLGEVFRIFLRHPKGCCLFNCTAGKDRTGIVAMLLLGLANVDRQVIVADYSASAGNMEPLFAKQRQMAKAAGFPVPDFLLQSNPEEMEATIAYIEKAHGSIEAYLHKILSGEEIQQLKARLIG